METCDFGIPYLGLGLGLGIRSRVRIRARVRLVRATLTVTATDVTIGYVCWPQPPLEIRGFIKQHVRQENWALIFIA